MTMKLTACIVATVAGFLFAPTLSLAQTTTPAPPPHVPLQKTIGQAGPDIVPSLIVLSARGANLDSGKLILTGSASNSIVFADRPVRAAGHVLMVHLLEEWAPGNEEPEGFTKDPPNATVSAFNKDGTVIRDAVVVLKTAKLDGDRLTFDVDVLEGDLTGADGAASIFIDRFGFGGFHGAGFARGGFARGGVAVGPRGGIAAAGRVGVAHVGYVGHGAWYRGAGIGVAAVGGAALGAAAVGGAAALGAAAASAYGPYGVACGYYPYPPCY